LEDGRREVLDIKMENSESAAAWEAYFRSMIARGFKMPNAFIGDGGNGLWAAVKNLFPEAGTMLCLLHSYRDAKKYVGRKSRNQLHDLMHDIFACETMDDAKNAMNTFAIKFSAKSPKAVKTILGRAKKLLSFYNYPKEHWKHICTSNLIESLFSVVRIRIDLTRGMSVKNNMEAYICAICADAQKHFSVFSSPEMLSLLAHGVKFKDGLPQPRCSVPDLTAASLPGPPETALTGNDSWLPPPVEAIGIESPSA
jgi:transposase-like protein